MSSVPNRRARKIKPGPSHKAAATFGNKDVLVTPGRLRAYWELTKPEISLLVALSAFAGYLLGSAGGVDLGRLFFLMVGVTLTAAGAGALNHWLEREEDGQMKRTMGRPIPSGRITASAARNFGCVCVGAGTAILCPLTNPLTGVLAIATVVLYLFVYTPLKRTTTWNTLIGTIPGALPALGGWTAATSSMGWGGWAIFAVLATWQMPHFFALAWMYRKDYERGGYAMLPVAEPSGDSTARQTLLYTIALGAASAWPIALSLAGWMYGAGAVILGSWFVRASWLFYRSHSSQDARRVLKVSIAYIPLLVLALLIDRLFTSFLS